MVIGLSRQVHRISEAIKPGELKGNISLQEPNIGYLSSKPNIGHFRKSFFIIQYNKNNKQCVRVFRKHIAGHQAIESSYYQVSTNIIWTCNQTSMFKNYCFQTQKRRCGTLQHRQNRTKEKNLLKLVRISPSSYYLRLLQATEKKNCAIPFYMSV